jgi:hypothetical protein
MRFIDHLQVVTTNKYSAIANLHILQFTMSRTKSSWLVFTSGFLVTDLNNALCLCPSWLAKFSQLTKLKVEVTLRLAYRQSVHLGVRLLEGHDQRIFQLNFSGNNYHVTSSLTRRWVCLLWIGFAFVKCTYRTYRMLLKILPFALCESPLSVQALQSRSCLTYVAYATTAV